VLRASLSVQRGAPVAERVTGIEPA
jgi:hypothetical protein